jgi:hypothetical protein
MDQGLNQNNIFIVYCYGTFRGKIEYILKSNELLWGKATTEFSWEIDSSQILPPE